MAADALDAGVRAVRKAARSIEFKIPETEREQPPVEVHQDRGRGDAQHPAHPVFDE